MTDPNDNYMGVLLEEIRDQNKAVLEAVGDMKEKVDTLPTRSEFLELKDDVKTIKAAVTDMGTQVNDHEQRITQLESS